MKNQISEGRTIDVTVAGDPIKSGDVVVMNDVAGVAMTDGKDGETIAVAVLGVFAVPKGAGVIQQGQKVYFSAADKNVVATAEGNTFIGYAWATATAAAPAIEVKFSF